MLMVALMLSIADNLLDNYLNQVTPRPLTSFELSER
jgi:hypothetical protein